MCYYNFKLACNLYIRATINYLQPIKSIFALKFNL
jgi:hypothetical protein